MIAVSVFSHMDFLFKISHSAKQNTFTTINKFGKRLLISEVFLTCLTGLLQSKVELPNLIIAFMNALLSLLYTTGGRIKSILNDRWNAN